MATQRRARPQFVIPALISHVVMTAFVWRDIGRRDPSELRGSKTIWRLLTAMNTGNHLLYWLVGRRRRPGV
jgi:hypothetical protein